MPSHKFPRHSRYILGNEIAFELLDYDLPFLPRKRLSGLVIYLCEFAEINSADTMLLRYFICTSIIYQYI